MFNLLIDGLPTEYRGLTINTSYKYGILISSLFDDDELEDEEKVYIALKLLYKDEIEIDKIKDATEGLFWYMSLGKNEWHLKEDNNGNNEPAIDYLQDSHDIYATFLGYFNIDLNKDDLHYWSFISLLSNLPDKCPLSSKIGFRTVDLSKLKGETKKYYAELKSKFAIQETKSDEQIKQEEKLKKALPPKMREILGM